MIIRKAVLEDIPLLIKLRMDFLVSSMGLTSEEEARLIEAQLLNYFRKHIPLEDFIAYIGEIDNKAVAIAFLTITEKPANANYITGKTAMIHNVLTYPNYRRRGIGSKLLHRLIEEAKKANVSSIDLFATEAGKPLYKKFGFAEHKNTYMRLEIREKNRVFYV